MKLLPLLCFTALACTALHLPTACASRCAVNQEAFAHGPYLHAPSMALKTLPPGRLLPPLCRATDGLLETEGEQHDSRQPPPLELRPTPPLSHQTRRPHAPLAGFRRSLLQKAAAAASGEVARAAASASSMNGQQTASTISAALGQGATAAGLSQAAGQVDFCLQSGNSGSAACMTLAPRIRSARCTDIPPDTRFTCTQQADNFKKCDADFLFVGAYCLKSCKRCGCEFQ